MSEENQFFQTPTQGNQFFPSPAQGSQFFPSPSMKDTSIRERTYTNMTNSQKP